MTQTKPHKTPDHMKSFYATLKRSHQNSRNGTMGADKVKATGKQLILTPKAPK